MKIENERLKTEEWRFWKLKDWKFGKRERLKWEIWMKGSGSVKGEILQIKSISKRGIGVPYQN